MGRSDEAWIGIWVTPEDYERCFVGNEWQDESWPTRQWLIPAAEANRFPRREVPLEEVLYCRIHGTPEARSVGGGGTITAEEMSHLIDTEMDDPIKARWRAALKAVGEADKTPFGQAAQTPVEPRSLGSQIDLFTLGAHEVRP
jgi:hypothetical protein